jgi:hypothetical protein
MSGMWWHPSFATFKYLYILWTVHHDTYLARVRVGVCAHARGRVCVCVCVCEREREREWPTRCTLFLINLFWLNYSPHLMFMGPCVCNNIPVYNSN